MTVVELTGSPNGPRRAQLPTRPARGDSIVDDGETFRLYQRDNGTWVGVWVGFEHVGPADLVGDDDPTGKPLPPIVEPFTLRWWGRAATVAAFMAGAGAAAVAFVALVAWALEHLAGWVGGWSVLALAVGAGSALVGVASAVAWPETLTERKTK